MNLIIVESPTKSKTLSRFLGQNYKVVSSMGHIRDLPKSKFGIDVENDFEPHYIIMPKARKTVSSLKKKVKQADSVILGCDEDREGEAIAYHLTKALNLNHKDYQRIVFHEITKSAIKEALKNPRKIDMSLVNAQQARRILDRIVGYKLSPFLWKKVARRLSAGRVQSVAVRLVVEREQEIDDFEPQEYWTVKVLLQSATRAESGKEFTAKLIKKDDKKIPKLGIKTKDQADKIVKDLRQGNYKVGEIIKKEKKRNPYPPFTTSSLLRDAGIKFKFPSKLTMGLAQNLYEQGYITYHRTDSVNIASQALGQAKKLILDKFGKNYLKIRKYKTKGAAQEAHEAIRPTSVSKQPEQLKSELKKNQLKLYQLIWNRFVASQMAPAVFDSTKVKVVASSEGTGYHQEFPSGIKKYGLKAKGKVMEFDGFTKVYPIKFKQKSLPKLSQEEVLELLKLKPEQHFTKPPPRYSEATLIKTLKKEGIGRPSTYAPIISTIQNRNYVQLKKKRFYPTEIGTVVNNLLVEHFPKVVDLKFTAGMEQDLDQIANDKKQWTQVVREFYEPFIENLNQKYKQVSKKDIAEKKTEKKCPKCGSPLLIKLGKYGRFYACSNFPDCKYTEALPKHKLGINCPQCNQGEMVEKRTKKGKLFYGCNRYPKCDFAVWNKPYITKNKKGPKVHFCPKCDSLLVETKRYIKCSNKDCDFKKKKDKK